MDKLKQWWRYDSEAEKQSADNPVTPLTESQRRGTIPLLTLAFGWGFLVTGLFIGGMLGSGQVFWPDIIAASFAGNVANFVIGALVDQRTTSVQASPGARNILVGSGLCVSPGQGCYQGFFDGFIDELMIFDRAFTLSEIISIFEAGSAG